MSSALVTTQWLGENLGKPGIKIIDASYFPPNIKRNPRDEYQAEHIPGAVFFDIDDIADKASGLPHMLPSADVFAKKISALGIGNDDLVVAYDTMGLFSAPRAWWMLRAMGHDKVVVLDGGLPKWREEARPLTTDMPEITPSSFKPQIRPQLIRKIEDVTANLKTRNELLIDARSAGRFAGIEPEVWPGRRGGHIPFSANLPFPELLTPSQTLRPLAEIEARFEGLNYGKPLTVCCGSGVSACVLALALYEIGQPNVAVYDGSWAEWGLNTTNHPVETGPLSTGQSAV